MHKFRLLLEYDGSEFAGWQFQPVSRTIQGELERAIKTFTREDVRITGAGRTDSGVHALGQTASFNLENPPEPGRLLNALNGILPRDVRVLSAAEAFPDFNARADATCKTYRYRILNRPTAPAIGRGFMLHVHRRLDVEAMNKAAGLFLGEHDFSAFRASDCECAHARRVVLASSVKIMGNGIVDFVVTATAFVKNMVRIMAGTLLEVAANDRSVESISEALLNKSRNLAGKTAPPHGLFLEKVFYGKWPDMGIIWP